MPHHIIVKKQEFEVAPKLLEVFGQFKCFLVHEVGNDGDHWHFWTDCTWKDDKVRRQVDKVRASKQKGVSIRPWDDNMIYFCKGPEPNKMPDILFNNVITQEDVEYLHTQWWTTHFDNNDLNPDIKPPKILDMLVDQCRDKDLTAEQVVDHLIDILMQCGGKKMASIKSTGQAYVRTALLFTSNSDFYKRKLKSYYMDGLF